MSQTQDKAAPRETGLSTQIAFPKVWLELAVALALLALAIYYVGGALALPAPRNPSDVGPGAFPLLVGVGTLFALALLLGKLALRALRGAPGDVVIVPRAPRVALAMVVLVLTATLFARLGLVPVTLGCSALLMGLAGARRPVLVALTAVGLTAGLYVLFVTVLGVRFY